MRWGVSGTSALSNMSNFSSNFEGVFSEIDALKGGVRACVCVCACVRVVVCVCVCVGVCVYVYMYIYISIYVYIYSYTQICQFARCVFFLGAASRCALLCNA